MSLHPLALASKRNERKAILYSKWIALGSVSVNFDATAQEVAFPESLRHDFDMYITVDANNAKMVPTGLEGIVGNPKGGTFDFFIPWAQVTSLFSHALNEKHIYFEDFERAVARDKSRKLVAQKKVLPS